MDIAREVIDGLWMIRQDQHTRQLMIYYCGRLNSIKETDRLLDFSGLRKVLISVREEARENE